MKSALNFNKNLADKVKCKSLTNFFNKCKIKIKEILCQSCILNMGQWAAAKLRKH